MCKLKVSEDTRERPVETNMYYCHSRYYMSRWCRWLNADNTNYLEPEHINGMNLYQYCDNDPINCVDPSGNLVISISVIIIGATIGFGSVYLSDVVENVKEDGFQFSDLATINKDNIFEYAVNTIGGALTGFVGGLVIIFLVSAPLVGAINTGVAGAYAIYYIGGLIDDGWEWFKKQIFE